MPEFTPGRDPAMSATATEATDMIVRWDEVRDGDEVLHHGRLGTAAVMPHGNAWQPEGCASLVVDGTWIVPRRDHLTAVRRKAEG